MAYCFGDFVLDARTGTLTGPGGAVPLRRQAFRLCEVLLENAPELMDRDQLLDEVWGRTAVSPNVLPQTISELRQALGDNPQQPRYIETKHRRGYRIVCPVEQIESRPDAGRTEDRAAVSAAVPDDPAIDVAFQVKSKWLLVAWSFALILAGSGGWIYWQWQQSEALYRETIPEIREAVDSDLFAAWRSTRSALERFPGDPELQQLMLDLAVPISLSSEPPGARVAVGPYNASDADWVDLGRAPVTGVRLPLTMLRFRFEKPGHLTRDIAPSVLPVAETVYLHSADETPPGMVFVPPGRVSYMGQSRELDGFWIQQNEVTNRDYAEFVESSGYQNGEYWEHEVSVNGEPLSQERIAQLFVDSTGIPGPSSWALGTFPEGKENHPVQGISWFEAAAYAKFRGMELPTAFHWWRAAGRGGAQETLFGDIVTASNFQSDGTWPVGTGGLGPYGTRDMAGNVGEWCANASGSSRHYLGGSWITGPYAFMDAFAQPAMSRGPGFGARLISTSTPVSAEQLADIPQLSPSVVEPVGDATFDIFARQFNYDRAPLNAVVEDIDMSHRAWRRERITFDAAYGDERILLQLFLPSATSPPYQVVVHFPGGDAIMLEDSADAGLLSVEPFLRTGRAVAYPVYQGTFERKWKGRRGPLGARKLVIEQTQDVSRTLDYLETREDIAADKIAFHGLSYGGLRSPFVLATEDRFATAMILSAGIPSQSLPPEITVQHYLPRVTLPTLYVGGRDDFDPNLETSQIPFFELLGTPADQKRHVTFEGGHLPTGYSGLKRTVIGWLDETLGKP